MSTSITSCAAPGRSDAIASKTFTAQAILFDLDGTVVDTAPDLGAAANHVRAEAGLPPLPLERYRAFASGGARALLKIGMDLMPEHPDFPARRESFLKFYRANLSRRSRVFPEVQPLLSALEARHLAWGIVTNKPAWLAEPLMRELGLAARTACVVGSREGIPAKPAPDLLLEACRQLRRPPAECVYVGDDRRDVDAARAAGMPAIAARWGYLGAGESPAAWQADAIIDRPADLLALLA